MASSPAPAPSNIRTDKQAPVQIAIIGGGITGACAASVLTSAITSSLPRREGHCSPMPVQPTAADMTWSKRRRLEEVGKVRIDLFDQGRGGVGGRSSSRRTEFVEMGDDGKKRVGLMRWDHGCQFFRADTPRFQRVVDDWIKRNIASEWKGTFITDDPTGALPQNDFFGMPSHPPFYVGVDGMQRIPERVLDLCVSSSEQRICVDEGCGATMDGSGDDDYDEEILSVFNRTRVSRMERDESTQKWRLYGTSGRPAFHDTGTKTVNAYRGEMMVGRFDAYDAVLLTDVSSSSFGSWHRASAGVPERFAERVRQRVGARVPLFTAMLAFDTPLPVKFDAASFHKSDVLWFACRTNSKPGPSDQHEEGTDGTNDNVGRECWTLVSTPEYAMEQITQTPMQDPQTGAFLPQNKKYLTSVPGPDLETAFRSALSSATGILGEDALDPADIPSMCHLDAQRWGSAMPSHRHLDETSETRRVIVGVPYESGRGPLAPTRIEKIRRRRDSEDEDGANDDDRWDFISDEERMLFQAGDMMSRYTPGFEGAALSGMDAAEHMLNLLIMKEDE